MFRDTGLDSTRLAIQQVEFLLIYWFKCKDSLQLIRSKDFAVYKKTGLWLSLQPNFEDEDIWQEWRIWLHYGNRQASWNPGKDANGKKHET